VSFVFDSLNERSAGKSDPIVRRCTDRLLTNTRGACWLPVVRHWVLIYDQVSALNFPGANRCNDGILTAVLSALIRVISPKLETQCAKMAGQSHPPPGANELLLNGRQWPRGESDKGHNSED
jgi:hypothetical protein